MCVEIKGTKAFFSSLVETFYHWPAVYSRGNFYNWWKMLIQTHGMTDNPAFF